ncbi:extradiol dioxygenase [Nonomuraea phyllanthi]|uniref:Extradiol dioxygenase n=1 Tax=Nonomuraea phyllanthi TaxID=2219224 RepID=A0A5C4W1P6_9ACTN|nr:extradiol dioxygenase [Nonomuraea phyllanthi]KAB8191525.1 extradiol dioxygenase [Nonomuraea phyllanthi]
MIRGLHLLLLSQDPAADRAFLRDVLGWPWVEDQASEPGWLIFETPPTEMGVHPVSGRPGVALHLMCDGIAATVAELKAKGVPVGEVVNAGYGLATTVTLPSGAEVGLYEPRHKSPLAAFDRT